MIMKVFASLILILIPSFLLPAQEVDRAAYTSPYKVKFSFDEQDLIGDLQKGSRGDWKDQAAVPYSVWYDRGQQPRWGYWGPPARHFNAPSGLASRSPDWSRERIIATGLKFVGYSYQHHHVPDWMPPEDWPRDPEQKGAPGKGVDCSNFTAFVYNLALGVKPTGDVKMQAEMTEAEGPGPGKKVPVRRIELPQDISDYERKLLPGDLLFIKNSRGSLSHVVLWVGKLSDSPDGQPLILDSTGTGAKDSRGNDIPDGVYLRPFTSRTWYFRQASHALRIIPGDKHTAAAR